MKTFEGYLCLKKKGYYQLTARLTQKSPALQAGEVAVKLSVKVPDALFTTPQLRADIQIPESAVTPPTLDAVVLDNVREVLEQQTGMQVQVAVVEPS